jgi:alkyl-hydroperoxide reductase/thiol specific antioxidant family protein
MFCRELAVQLHRERDGIEARGADLVLVGNGAPHFARAFAEELGLSGPLYVDPSLSTYHALEMGRASVISLVSARVLRSAARALRGGFRQGLVRGDAWQLGGVLVVRPGGEVAYRHLAGDAGDNPPIADVLAALEPARGERLPAAPGW